MDGSSSGGVPVWNVENTVRNAPSPVEHASFQRQGVKDKDSAFGNKECGG